MFNLFRRPRSTLVECRACGTEFVHPVEWHPHDDERWWMLLHCGACGFFRETIASNANADMYDLELDRMQADMRSEAERLQRERQAEEAETFATALEAGLISPEDFVG
ncbi:MAG TPA: hypothetical protein VFB44_09170 [Thermoleophilaceae bacterium]|nr:hypothetical protein [Thermoleophilaceae bacterium]